MLGVLLTELTEREKQLILFVRQLGWGDLKIRVENGQPVFIYEAVRTFKLEEKESKYKPVTGIRRDHPDKG